VRGKLILKVFAWAVSGALLLVLALYLVTARPASIAGAIVTASDDPARQLPVGDVEISVWDDPQVGPVRSDASGFFHVPISWRMRRSALVTLHFRHPDYQPFDLPGLVGDKLWIVHLPLAHAAVSTTPRVKLSNIVVRYSLDTTTAVNIGSAVKTFEVVNRGNVPCHARDPCSPDGKWKAATGSAMIDAGPGNEFHNARASCIAGPCPFTRVDENGAGPSRNGRTFRVSALDWSDTATFLVEAEVYKPVVRGTQRQSYPLIFDRALTFTLPASVEGVSIQAEVNGTAIVFPLGPALFLSWADCQMVVNKDQTRLYRCELKPGFRF